MTKFGVEFMHEIKTLALHIEEAAFKIALSKNSKHSVDLQGFNSPN